MTPEDRKNLLHSMAEYSAGLARIEGERGHLKAMALNASTRLGIDAKAFIMVATAYHKDKIRSIRTDKIRSIRTDKIRSIRTEMEHTTDLFDLLESPAVESAAEPTP